MKILNYKTIIYRNKTNDLIKLELYKNSWRVRVGKVT